jgi:hypothetical protein
VLGVGDALGHFALADVYLALQGDQVVELDLRRAQPGLQLPTQLGFGSPPRRHFRFLAVDLPFGLSQELRNLALELGLYTEGIAV